MLCQYLEALWDAGCERNSAGDTISGVQHFLHQRRCFHGAWGLFATWSKTELPARAPPLTSHMLLAMCGASLILNRPDIAALLTMGFHCMLRTEEMLSAKWQCIIVDACDKGAIALPLTKSGQIHGAQEVVTIDDPVVGRTLRKVAALYGRSTGPILTCTRTDFRTVFDTLIRMLNLSHLKLRPYSVRRGGATHDYGTHGDIARSVWRGRWADSRTARIYVTDGLARQIQHSLSQPQQARIAECSQHFMCWLNG